MPKLAQSTASESLSTAKTVTIVAPGRGRRRGAASFETAERGLGFRASSFRVSGLGFRV